MQQQATLAYQQTARQTVNPRELEANILSRAAINLVRIQESWDDNSGKGLSEALAFNTRLWSVFLDTVTKADNPLPKDIKENIGSLGVFVLSHTLAVQSDPEASKLDVLISINREVAAGLRDSIDAE